MKFSVPDWSRRSATRISAQEDATFIDAVVGARFLSPGAQYFDGNLARIGTAIREAVAAEA